MKKFRHLPAAGRSGRWVLSAAAVSVFCAWSQIPPAGYVFVPREKETALYLLIRNHGDQQRVQVVLDPRLCSAARKHAEDMQRRAFFGHVNPSGVNSNQRVMNEGYPLPASYVGSRNNVESLAGVPDDSPASVLALWRGSEAHANHIFGRTNFYRQQVVMGVGHAPASGLRYATYVFISAPPPTGQNWSIAAGAAAFPRVEVSSSGGVSFFGAQPESILEVWRADGGLVDWSLERTVVVPPGGRFNGSAGQGGRGFFRFGYFRSAGGG